LWGICSVVRVLILKFCVCVIRVCFFCLWVRLFRLFSSVFVICLLRFMWVLLPEIIKMLMMIISAGFVMCSFFLSFVQFCSFFSVFLLLSQHLVLVMVMCFFYGPSCLKINLIDWLIACICVYDVALWKFFKKSSIDRFNSCYSKCVKEFLAINVMTFWRKCWWTLAFQALIP